MKGNDLVLSQELQCKNCKQPLGNHDKFCSDCAAKVISERITFKNLIGDLIKDNLGIDNKYFYTVASMITKPSRVLEEYLGGTRKKYVHALTFLVIGMTLAIFAFNVFDEEYMAMNDAFQKSQFEWYGENLGGPFANPEYQEKEMARSSQMQRYMLKYFNIMVVILLPIYSFITYFVYGKPYFFKSFNPVSS